MNLDLFIAEDKGFGTLSKKLFDKVYNFISYKLGRMSWKKSYFISQIDKMLCDKIVEKLQNCQVIAPGKINTFKVEKFCNLVAKHIVTTILFVDSDCKSASLNKIEKVASEDGLDSFINISVFIRGNEDYLYELVSKEKRIIHSIAIQVVDRMKEMYQKKFGHCVTCK